jgi:hypothetical protein
MSSKKTTLLNFFPNKQHSHSHQSGNYIEYTFRSYQISTVELRSKKCLPLISYTRGTRHLVITLLVYYTKGTCHLVITSLVYTKVTRHLMITPLVSYTKWTRHLVITPLIKVGIILNIHLDHIKYQQLNWGAKNVWRYQRGNHQLTCSFSVRYQRGNQQMAWLPLWYLTLREHVIWWLPLWYLTLREHVIL